MPAAQQSCLTEDPKALSPGHAFQRVRAGLLSLVSQVAYHGTTFFLFVRSDFKTMVFPSFMFGTVVGELSDFWTAVQMFGWIMLHLMGHCTSNQLCGIDEDAILKPYRPLPSKRVTPDQVRRLRYVVYVSCLLSSMCYGWRMLVADVVLTALELYYNDFGGAGHWLMKNVCNAAGYGLFEYGAATIAAHGELPPYAARALVMSVSLVTTTVHQQDFADVEGDSAEGRKTIPIIAPELSRIVQSILLPLWSTRVAALWGLGPMSAAAFTAFGTMVATRSFYLRDQKSDQRTYLLYNIWIIAAHALPINARYKVFSR